MPIDPERSLDFMMSSYQRAVRNARREFNAKLLRGEEVSPQDIIDRYIIANKAKWESMKKMSLDLTAGQILGVTDDQIEPVLGRISRKDSDALVEDEFIPFTISDNIKRVFEENAAKLGVSNPYEEAENAIESLSDVMSEINLTESVWPDLTQLFNTATAVPLGNLTQTPIGTPALSPQTYNRPSLTLNPVTGLTRAQTALLSPADQQYYMQRNRNRVT